MYCTLSLACTLFESLLNFSNEAFKSDSCVWTAFNVATNDVSDSVLGFSPVTLSRFVVHGFGYAYIAENIVLSLFVVFVILHLLVCYLDTLYCLM